MTLQKSAFGAVILLQNRYIKGLKTIFIHEPQSLRPQAQNHGRRAC